MTFTFDIDRDIATVRVDYDGEPAGFIRFALLATGAAVLKRSLTCKMSPNFKNKVVEAAARAIEILSIQEDEDLLP